MMFKMRKGTPLIVLFAYKKVYCKEYQYQINHHGLLEEEEVSSSFEENEEVSIFEKQREKKLYKRGKKKAK